MLLKSLLAGTVMSVLAGGVVYFGLGGELSDNAKIDRVVEKAADVKDDVMAGAEKAIKGGEQAAESSRDKLDALMGKEPKLTYESRQSAPKDTKDVKVKTPAGTVVGDAKDEAADPPKKRWLDEYLKSEKKADQEKAETPDVSDADQEIEVVDLEDAPEKATVIKVDPETEPVTESDMLEAEETVKVTKEILEDGRVKTITTKTKRQPEADGRVTVTKDVETIITDAGADKIRKKITPMKPSAKAGFDVKDPKATAEKPSRPTMGHGPLFDLLMGEADKLDIPDMRDQAYLNIVDFALVKGDRAIADTALEKLSREELRDTARGRVAVALAKAGESEAAFDVIKTLEIEELQGPIRLQVIEALTIGKIPTN